MQTQTLSLKRQISLTTVGYLFKGIIYATIEEFKAAQKKVNKKQIEKDVCNVLKAASLQQKLNDAQQQLKKHYSFAGYCLVCTCKRLLKAFKLTLDKLAKQMLF